MDVTFPEYAFETQANFLQCADTPEDLRRQADIRVSENVLPKPDEPNRM